VFEKEMPAKPSVYTVSIASVYKTSKMKMNNKLSCISVVLCNILAWS